MTGQSTTFDNNSSLVAIYAIGAPGFSTFLAPFRQVRLLREVQSNLQKPITSRLL